MKSMFSLANKTAIVTGANTGLGQGMAIGLAKAGANIVGVNPSGSEETKKLVEALGVKYLEIKADLKEYKVVNSIIEQTIEHFGKFDILVNNAGIISRNDAIEYSMDVWNDVLDINLNTAFYFCQQAAKHFMTIGGGKIINIASMLSFQGGIRVCAYTASKTALKGLTMALSNEWAQYNINVNAIAPGYFITNNTEALRNDEARNQAIIERIPQARWGHAQDLVGAVIFLASSASNYVNGITLPVDGGWLGR